MARDLITLRPAPAAEACRQVGESGYAEIAALECRRYIALLRLAIGAEPDGARLRVRRADDEFDPYIDVVVEYDSENPAARQYALRCERDAPTRWRLAPPDDGSPPATRRAPTGQMDRNPVKERQS